MRHKPSNPDILKIMLQNAKLQKKPIHKFIPFERFLKSSHPLHLQTGYLVYLFISYKRSLKYIWDMLIQLHTCKTTLGRGVGTFPKLMSVMRLCLQQQRDLLSGTALFHVFLMIGLSLKEGRDGMYTCITPFPSASTPWDPGC